MSASRSAQAASFRRARPEPAYDPRQDNLLRFHDARRHFVEGTDDPRSYLERCLEVIERREPTVRAFVALDLDAARSAADQSVLRYRAGRPLSGIDGMPVPIKDMIDALPFPTEMGSPYLKGAGAATDAASVHALRSGGAIILGKTVTTEFGGGHPGPTTNPFDETRTPGGSSSGSAAAVGAGMVPVALGSQTGGSVIRPAAFCGNYALKPTFGSLNMGGAGRGSQSHLGIHAGSLEDLWAVCTHIAKVAGPDPGHPGLYWSADDPPARPPRRLAVVRTAGWKLLDPATEEAFLSLTEELRRNEVEVAMPESDAGLGALEAAIADALEVTLVIAYFESKWPLEIYWNSDPSLFSDIFRGRMERTARITIEEYRSALEKREEMRARLAQVSKSFDAIITLGCPGPAPVGIGFTGDLSFNVAASCTGAPAFTLPLLAVDGMPVGLQLMGPRHSDERLLSIAKWFMDQPCLRITR